MAASGDPSHASAYIRCQKALHLLTSETVHCVENCLQVWHTDITTNQCLQPCAGNCGKLKKQWCKPCQKWATHIENEWYHHKPSSSTSPSSSSSSSSQLAGQSLGPGPTGPGPPTKSSKSTKTTQPMWSNVNSSNFSKCHIEIAKAFVFRLPTLHSASGSSTNVANYANIVDFDSGSLLCIMTRFEPFHGGDPTIYEIIQKVGDIRNQLSHVPLKQNMLIDETEYFKNIYSMVACLEKLHPSHFDTSKVLRDKLLKIELEPVEASSIHDIQLQTYEAVQKLCKGIEPRQQGGQVQPIQQLADATLKLCRDNLRRHYLNVLCNIPMFLSDDIKLEDIYTKLSIVVNKPTPCGSVKMQLESHNDIFTRTTDEGLPYTKILISAPAGLGKTTLASKIAYDWARKENDSPLKDIELLFVLNMRLEDHESNLEEAILSQLLPHDTTITKEDIQTMIKFHGIRTVLILDSLDECDRELYREPGSKGNIVNLLTGKSLVASTLIIMSRPWRIKEIREAYHGFTQFEIERFSRNDVNIYVRKFFNRNPRLGESLIAHMNDHELIVDVASVPLMALLVCSYWMDIKGEEDVPHRLSLLYDAIFDAMYKHQLRKQGKEMLDEHHKEIDSMKNALGKMAMKGFWPPENRVTFSPDEVAGSLEERHALVNQACQIGLLYKENPSTSVIRKRIKQTSLTFFHKTYGEKCAGQYLANIVDGAPNEFQLYLNSLKTVDDALSVKLIMQFACDGKESKATEGILTKLIGIYESRIYEMIPGFEEGNLPLEKMIRIQNFILMILECNYEADQKSEFHSICIKLFPRGRIYFFSLPLVTAIVLSYFLLYSDNDIQSLHLQKLPRPGENPQMPTALYNSLLQYTYKKRPPIQFRYFFAHLKRNQISLDRKNEVRAHTQSQILLCQMCDELQGPVELETLKFDHIMKCLSRNSQIKALNISHFKIGSPNVKSLTESIESGKLSYLRDLRVSNIGMDGEEMERLIGTLTQIPELEVLDVSRNLAGRSFQTMASKTLPVLKQLQALHLDHMEASTESMHDFVKYFPAFGSSLLKLNLERNYVDELFVSTFAKHVSIARKLTVLSIGVRGLNRICHKELLLSLGHLSNLDVLEIHQSTFPNDLLKILTSVVQSMSDPNRLVLSTDFHKTPSVSKYVWSAFISRLHDCTALQLSDWTFEERFSRKEGSWTVTFSINSANMDTESEAAYHLTSGSYLHSSLVNNPLAGAQSSDEQQAGEYLAMLASRDSNKLALCLGSLETVEDALSINSMLQVACKANSGAARAILTRLVELYESEIQQLIPAFYEGTLHLEYMLEMCLACNYEADQKSEFNPILIKLFPEGRIYFFCIPVYTAIVLGYFLRHCDNVNILSVHLQKLPRAGEGIQLPTALYSQLQKFVYEQVPPDRIDLLFLFLKRNQVLLKAENNLRALNQLKKLLWKVCDKLQGPIGLESIKLGHIISGLSQTATLTELNLSELNMGKHSSDLVSLIERRKLCFLTYLHISVNRLNKDPHKELLLALKHLAYLRALQINNSQYPDDLVTNVALAMDSLNDLTLLKLGVEMDTAPLVSSVAWSQMYSRLHKMNDLNGLLLANIALQTEDFSRLVSLFRKKEVKGLGYWGTCLPEGIDVPSDDFFQLVLL